MITCIDRAESLPCPYPQHYKNYHGQQNGSSRPHHPRSSVHSILTSGPFSSLLAHPRPPSTFFKEIIYCLLFDPCWSYFLRAVSYTVYSGCRIQSRTTLQFTETSTARIFQNLTELFGPYIHSTLDSTMEM